jgi:hypothetical protein
LHPISIVCRGGSKEAVELVERSLYEAGFDTRLFVFESDPVRNSIVAVELAEAEPDSGLALQVWIVPSAFVTVEQEGRARTADVRRHIDVPRREEATRRLLILLDDHPLASEGDWLRLSDLSSGRVTPQMLGQRIQEHQKVTGPKPSS